MGQGARGLRPRPCHGHRRRLGHARVRSARQREQRSREGRGALRESAAKESPRILALGRRRRLVSRRQAAVRPRVKVVVFGVSLLLILPCIATAQTHSGSGQQVETYESATIDARGRLVITTSDGRTIRVPSVRDQTGFLRRSCRRIALRLECRRSFRGVSSCRPRPPRRTVARELTVRPRLRQRSESSAGRE